MPIYEYLCNDCSNKFTVYQTLKEREVGIKPSCPSCQSADVDFVFSPITIVTESKTEESLENFETPEEETPGESSEEFESTEEFDEEE